MVSLIENSKEHTVLKQNKKGMAAFGIFYQKLLLWITLRTEPPSTWIVTFMYSVMAIITPAPMPANAPQSAALLN